MKPSIIPGAGYGLFCEQPILDKDDVVTQFMGKQRKDYEQKSDYQMNKIDPMGGTNSNKPPFWGAHFINERSEKKSCNQH